MNCELEGFTNNFYRMTSDTYKYNFDSLIFHFDANNGDSYPGSSKNHNTPSYGKWWNLSGFNNNLQIYKNVNYDEIAIPILRNDGGRSFEFQGVYAKSNNLSDISGASPITIEAWVKFKSLSDGSFVSIGEDEDKKLFELALFNNRLSLNPGGIYNNSVTNFQVLDLNTWYHVVYTYNGNNRYFIYINGVFKSERTLLGNPISQNTTNTPLYIGKSQRPFNGRIGLLKVYKRCLSFTEIRKKYLDTKARFGY